MHYFRNIEPSPVALLTGAGASKAIGLPTMVEFREQFDSQLKPVERPLWKALLEAAAKSNGIGRSGVNIEHILTHIEQCEISYVKTVKLWKRLYRLEHGNPHIRQIHRFRQSLWKLRSRIHKAILAEYSSVCLDKVIECYIPLLSVLQEVSGQHLTNVFTTNYDPTFEVLAQNFPQRYEVSDGFIFNSRVYDANYIPECRAEHSLILFKLHGSTSWRYDYSTGSITKTRQPTGRSEEFVIVQPTVHKDLIQGRYSRPFNAGYSQLASLFSRGVVKVLLVIGYAFADAELRNNIAEGLAIESKATMVIVHPSLTRNQIKSHFPYVDDSRIQIVSNYFGASETLQLIRQAIAQVMSSPLHLAK